MFDIPSGEVGINLKEEGNGPGCVGGRRRGAPKSAGVIAVGIIDGIASLEAVLRIREI